MTNTRSLLRWRWPILLVVLAVCLVAGWISRGLEFNFSFWTLFGAEDPEVLRHIRYTDTWGEDSALLFVVLRAESGDVFTSERLRVIDIIERAASEIEGIESVRSILSTSTVRGEGDELVVGPLTDGVPSNLEQARRFWALAADNRLLLGTLVSSNGRTTLLALRMARELRDAKDRNPIVRAVEQMARAAVEGSGMRAEVAGIPVAQLAYSTIMAHDLAVFVAASFLLTTLFLGLMFRTAAGVILPSAVIMVAALGVVATIVATGEQINMINVALPTLIVVIGLADGVHLLADYYRRVERGDDPPVAIGQMMRHLGWACALTSLTTAIGFASLATARLGTVRSFGIYAALGIAYAFVANMLLMPIGLSFWRPKPRDRTHRRSGSRLWQMLPRLGDWITLHPVRTLSYALPLLLVLGAGVLRLKVESTMFEEIGDDDPVVLVHKRLEADLTGVTSYALDVTTAPGQVVAPEVLRSLDGLARFAESHPAVDRAMGIATVVKEMNRALHGGDPGAERIPDDPALVAQLLMLAEGPMTERLINAEQSRTQIWMLGPDVNATTWEALRAQLESRAAALAPRVEVVVTGSSSMAKRAIGAIVRDILTSLIGAAVVIFLLMSLLFRSVRIGLLSMVPNLLPLVVTVGVMGYAGIQLRMSTVIIFSVSLGLAVDDTIHFLVRFRRARNQRLDLVPAIHEAMVKAGRPIVYTSVILIGGFWILILSGFKAIRDVGLLGGVTLLTALVADLVILPALLSLIRGGPKPRGGTASAKPT